jgi:hypothetical protein
MRTSSLSVFYLKEREGEERERERERKSARERDRLSGPREVFYQADVPLVMLRIFRIGHV